MSVNKTWALALKRAQRRSQKDARSLDTQKRDVEHAIRFYKDKLKRAITTRSLAEVRSNYNSLVQERAKQVAILLDAVEDDYGDLDEDFKRFVVRQYYNDCIRLAAATDHLLGTRYAV